MGYKSLLVLHLNRLAFLALTTLFIPALAAGQNSPYDDVPSSSVGINGFTLGSKQEVVVAELGQPDSISTSVNDFSGNQFETYYYGRSEVAFESHKLDGFRLLDSTLAFNVGMLDIGAPAENVEQMLPKSYTYRSEEGAETIVTARIQQFDEWVTFVLRSGKVAEIWVRFDW